MSSSGEQEVKHRPAADPFSAYQASDAQAVTSTRAKRDAEPLTFTIENMAYSVEAIIKNDTVRQQLNDVVDKIKGMDVQKVEIIAYAPFFRELATPRAQAAKSYLVLKDVDENVISTHAKGVGYGGAASKLARNDGIKIEVTGTPKQDTGNQASTNPSRRSVPDLIA
jgi:hypothetical protein